MAAYNLVEIEADKFCRAIVECHGDGRMTQEHLLEVMKRAANLRSVAKAAACWEITQEKGGTAKDCTREVVNELADKYIAEVLK